MSDARPGGRGEGLLAATLRVLDRRFPHAAAALRAAQPAADVRLDAARNGDPVPIVRREGRDWFLHSRYDPRSEAARAVRGLPQPAFAVVYGLGAAHHLRALLREPGISGALVIESDASHVLALARVVELADVLADPRVDLLVGAPASAILQRLLASYRPLLDGALAQLALGPRTRTDEAYFAAAADAVAAAARSLADDVAVQARFGRRWFLNILGNLPAIAEGTDRPPVRRRAIVAAAGPTLGRWAAHIARAAASGSTLIATDTSLPALVQWGIAPAVVLSIDCQNVSYHHFLAGVPGGSRLALDVGSPPLIGRLAPRPLFLASPHPLASLLSRTLAPLPALDTSGGNVTHAAVGLALLLGAEEVEVLGADFSYPGGSPYARGTYFFPHFQSRATRLEPADSSLVAFVLADADAPPAHDAAGLRYRSGKLERYRARLLEQYGPVEEVDAGRLRCRRTADRPTAGRPTAGYATAGGSARPGSGAAAPWRAWLAAYLGGLRALAQPGPHPAATWAGLGVEERNLWTTLLPTAAAMPQGAPQERLEGARQWCCARIAARLQA